MSLLRPRLIALLLLLLLAPFGEAIVQTGQLDISLSNGAGYSMLVSQAAFGSFPPMKPERNPAWGLKLPPSDNALLCTNVTSASSEYDNSIILVPRGDCTFENKAMNAQRLGAKAILVRGTLASRYAMNKTAGSKEEKDIIYPQQYSDYDCSRGRGEIPPEVISMTPLPYNTKNDGVLSGTDNNLCLSGDANTCESNACLLTGNKTSDGKLEACCAWDLHILLYSDPIFSHKDVHIAAMFVTMQQGSKLLREMQDNTSVSVVMSMRPRSDYNLSSLLIWALGVFVAALAAYLSASDVRSVTAQVKRRAARQDEEVESLAGNQQQISHMPPAEETLELSASHACGFIIMASTGLFVLFFFKIYSVVKVLYGFGCSRAVMQVIFLPLFQFIFQKLNIQNKLIKRTNIEDIGDITTLDICAGICAYALGFTWLFVAFTVRHAEQNTFFWVAQDVMGSCMCIMFLSLIKLNSMRVAAILLIVAFLYDIFFVFITPLIFKGESVMITVATSGGPPKADPLWCEKYPNDTDCQGGDPLPMLLTMPRINDYQGGASLLGLGDIVLPGLLLSFAARLDAAKHLLGVMGGGSSQRNGGFCGSYYWPLVVGYGIGLFQANAAVYLMNMGQPALLYLVPMCLGTFCFLGWRRNELVGLWEGPKVIKTVEAMMYGEYEEVASTEVKEDGLEAASVPSSPANE